MHLTRSQKQKRYRFLRRGLLLLCLISMILFLILGVLKIFPLFHASQNRPSISSVMGIPLYSSFLDDDAPGRPEIRRQIKYIVIHETGNVEKGADAKSHHIFLHSGQSGTTSWHYTVDDTCIYQHIPDNEIAWHAGDRRISEGGNMCGISIELCVNADGDFEQTFQNGARLAAFLMETYQLPPENLKQHADFIAKNCPETIRNNHRWEEFCKAVSTYREELKSTPSA